MYKLLIKINTVEEEKNKFHTAIQLYQQKKCRPYTLTQNLKKLYLNKYFVL